MNTTYIPRADSLADKVCRYFLRLPDEELLTREIAANYDVESKSVAVNLKLAIEAGYLAVDGTVYSAGPQIARFVAALSGGKQPPAGAEGTPPPATRGTPRKAPSRAFSMDLSTVEIDKGVPMPSCKVPKLDWSALLTRMEPGDSILLPAEARSAIGSAVTKFKRSTGRVLSIRTVADGVRVWRTS